MKDLQKMRDDFEREYRLAELANKIETEHPEITESGIEPHIYDGCIGTRGWFSEKYPHKLCEKDAGMLLTLLPPDEQWNIYKGQKDEEVMSLYSMTLTRFPSDANTILEIEWIHEGVKWSVKFPIMNDSGLHGWLKYDTRRLSESEISSWGIQKTRYNKRMREDFVQLNWCCGRVVIYNNDRYQQVDEAIMDGIVEHLKYQYQFSEE